MQTLMNLLTTQIVRRQAASNHGGLSSLGLCFSTRRVLGPRKIHSEGAFQLEVNKQDPTLVAPSEETKTGPFFLSNLDQLHPFVVRRIYCFRSEEKGNERAVQVLKDSLSRVLVHYYPVAGRLKLGQEGMLAVECTGEGALFVEAEANCAMDEIGNVTKKYDPATLAKLVYDVPGAKSLLDIPPLVAQVTKFKCGGFVVGLGTVHNIFDGVSSTGFMNSWGETARGLPLKTPPFLDRTVLRARNPPKTEYPHPEFQPYDDISNISHLFNNNEDLIYRSFCFDYDKLQKLKAKAMTKCTTFEALSAFAWRTRTRALPMEAQQQSKLFFPIDIRSRLNNPPLPEGYFGNGIVPASAMCTAGELLDKPLSFAVSKVQRAAAEMTTDRYTRSMIDYLEAKRPPRQTLPSTLVITSWRKLPFDSVDFGWGRPVFYGPADLPFHNFMVLMSGGGEDRKSVNVYVCLPASSMETFENLMMHI